ncbi:MAG: TraB/VirB10 family protein [Pseudomonadota bacterium]|nr:TraB/VirB10 family protein [Nevskiales bacterium]MEC9358645.1 TraB/VirB10 family protein [Pseudomonadota bacterium]
MSPPDLKRRLSIKQRQVLATVAVLGGVMLVIILGLYVSDPRRGEPDTLRHRRSAEEVLKDYRTPRQDIDPADVWMARSEARLRELQQRSDELGRRLERLQDQVRQQDEGPVLPPPQRESASRPEPPAPATYPQTPLPPPPSATRIAASPQVALSAPIMDVSLLGSAASNTPDADAEPTATVHNSLPVGSFASAVLLTGLDAPTGGLAKTNPIPVLMLLLNDGSLPNRFRSRVRDCFVSGAGYGDAAAERAYIRLERLSCVMHDGRILDAQVEGYIAGEDGKNGLRGPVVSKQGQMIARALFAGIASGLGNSIAQSYASISTSALGSVRTVDPDDIAKVGVATGVGTALEKIADFYIARANELYPVVEIDSFRRGDVVFNQLVHLGPAFAAAWDGEEVQR